MKEPIPLSDFYETIVDDVKISVRHISVYVSLLYFSNLNGAVNPVMISRNDLMKAAKISRNTLSKCIQELQAFGYIKYSPASNHHTLPGFYLRKL